MVTNSKLYKLSFSPIFIELLNKMDTIESIRTQLLPYYTGAVRSARNGDEEGAIKYLRDANGMINQLKARGILDKLPPGSMNLKGLRKHCEGMAYTCDDILHTVEELHRDKE